MEKIITKHRDKKCSESFISSDSENKCEFETTSKPELKVHQLNCEICDFKAVTQSELEVHVVTCELYRCTKCDFKSKRLSQVKTHLRKKNIDWVTTLYII